MLTLLDGPMGTELNRRGVATPLPLWSAGAIESAPDIVSQIHRDYAVAGATIHTANTFRTKRRDCGANWHGYTRAAIELARNALPQDHRVFGSISPLEDCYEPWNWPGEKSLDEHREMAEELATLGCDGLLCETFANPDEAISAVSAAKSTGLETWLALTAGPAADLMTPEILVSTARRAVELGVSTILINCVPATQVSRFLMPLVQAISETRIGVYANAGAVSELIGWYDEGDARGAREYAKLAQAWVRQGASIIGGCCGTGPEHIAACHAAFQELGWLASR